MNHAIDETEYDPSDEESDVVWDEEDSVILGAHGYHRNCMCYFCNPPGFMPGE